MKPCYKVQFGSRSSHTEWMDNPAADPEVVLGTLPELAIVNKFLGGYGSILSGIASFTNPKQPLHIVDVGCGGGDTLIAIAKWARRYGQPVLLTGLDYHGPTIAFAQRVAQAYPEIKFQQMDIWSTDFAELKADIVVNSLFCHHFAPAQLIPLLQRMARVARKAVVISDLHRHPIAYYSFIAFWHLFLKSPMVRYDGPLSVLRAYTRSEWAAMLRQAGFGKYTLRWKWAFRWQVIIKNNC